MRVRARVRVRVRVRVRLRVRVRAKVRVRVRVRRAEVSFADLQLDLIGEDRTEELHDRPLDLPEQYHPWQLLVCRAHRVPGEG